MIGHSSLGSEKLEEGYIPENLYRRFVSKMPVCCVDVVILHNDKILLLKRKKRPAQRKWWTPGGRLIFNETLQDAALRIAKKETGLSVKIIRPIGVYQATFYNGYFGNPCHAVSTVFLVVPVGEVNVELDDQSSDYKWVPNIPRSLRKLYLEEPKTVLIS